MDHQEKQRPTDTNDRTKRFVSRDNAAILLGFVAIILWGVSAFHDHARGKDWLSAVGFTPDRELFQIFGNFIVPVLMTVFLMQTVRKLPPSRQKTKVTWICWTLFVFLFVWWSPLHTLFFGQ